MNRKTEHYGYDSQIGYPSFYKMSNCKKRQNSKRKNREQSSLRLFTIF